MDGRTQNVVWAPQAGPQHAYVDCPLPIVFFGGARGGGKTDGVLGKWAIKEARYGRAFNAIFFRKSTVSAEDAIERSREIYKPLGGKFSEAKLIWRMPRGGRVSFKYLETVADANEYQGRNVTDACVEEAGLYPSPEPIDRLHGVLRSKHGVPTQLTLLANPGGAGQHWMRDRFGLYPLPSGPKIVPIEIENPLTHEQERILQAVIPAKLDDNKILMAEDPGYVARLTLSGGAKLVRAWLLGDWSAIEGAFFDEWNTQLHVLQPFSIPEHWLKFGAFDWGSAKPFSMGWYAVVPDDYTTPTGVKLPADSLVKYREWYGAQGVNKGLKLTAEKIGEGVVEREAGETINYRVADPACFAEDGGPSHAERMADQGAIFWPADNKRVARAGHMGGWDMMRARLLGHGHRDEHGIAHVAPGEPMLYFFSTCVDSIRTIPVLQHDERKPEDLNTDQEDHGADEARYACMSRPWAPDQTTIVTPTLDAWGRPRNEATSWKVA